MFGIYFFMGAVVILNLYTHLQIYKDDTYLLDEEKLKLILMTWGIPLIGAFISLQRLHANKNFYIGITVVYVLLKLGLYYLLFGMM